MAKKQVEVLPAKLIRQLGKATDSALADEYHISVWRVRKERLNRGIPRAQSGKWTPQQIALLGKMSDSEAARRAGCTTTAAFVKRTSLGIAPFGKSLEETRFQWKASHLKQLGKVSDATLAQELGISASVVASKRYSSGIASGIYETTARNPWTKSEISMLGKKPDTVVAKLTGRGRRHIRAKRESLGIPAFQIQRSIPWTKTILKQLGTMPDAEIAKSIGVSLGTVALHRRRLGIKPFRRSATDDRR
jgi:hypothetical protein